MSKCSEETNRGLAIVLHLDNHIIDGYLQIMSKHGLFCFFDFDWFQTTDERVANAP
jgi:hypothetical protein